MGWDGPNLVPDVTDGTLGVPALQNRGGSHLELLLQVLKLLPATNFPRDQAQSAALGGSNREAVLLFPS